MRREVAAPGWPGQVSRRRRRCMGAALAALAGAAGPARASNAELVLGLLPNVSAALVAAQYEPLRRQLETPALPVRLALPSSFRGFARSLMAGEFDLAVAAPHFARVAQLDAGLRPLAMFEPRLAAVLVVATSSPLGAPADLRGRCLTFANPGSLVAIAGQRWLATQGLEAGRDYEVNTARTDFGVGRLVLTGAADAAILSAGELRALPADELSRLRVLETFQRLPNFIVVAHPRLGAPLLAQLRTRLLALVSDAERGPAFARASGVTGIVDVDAATLRELDAYVEASRRVMAGTG